jgi:hypothetical protein
MLKLFVSVFAAVALPAFGQSTLPPTCEGKMQCDAMWLDAQRTVEMVTRMRLRMVTDSRIETFAPVRYASMGGVVTKHPIAEDKYEIRLQLECYRNTDCSDVMVMGTDLFNKTVGGPR